MGILLLGQVSQSTTIIAVAPISDINITPLPATTILDILIVTTVSDILITPLPATTINMSIIDKWSKQLVISSNWSEQVKTTSTWSEQN